MVQQALEGVTVIDFTQAVQGPYATQRLGDMGAEVIKIEKTDGEIYRGRSRDGPDIGGENPLFHGYNRNKKSLTLDLKTEEGHEICMELGKTADVVVSNYRPDVMERLGLEYEDFKSVNEEIIYCQATGYGKTGPYTDLPGQDLLIQSLTGNMMVNGWRNHPPIPTGFAVVDVHASMVLAFSIMVALFHKERTGEGQRVDSNLLSAGMDMQAGGLTAFMNSDQSIERSQSGIASPWASAPYGVYETKDGYITISSSPDMDALAKGLELPELIEYSSEEFYENREEIWEQINEKFQEKPTDEWLDILDRAATWIAPVHTYEDVVSDPQVEHNGMIKEVEHPDEGEIKLLDFPATFSETPSNVDTASPVVGESNRSLLASLGYSEEQISELAEKGVIGDD